MRRIQSPLRQITWVDSPLLLGMVVVAIPTFALPQPTLDGSWNVGLQWARALGFHFGSDINFTYGPWIALDSPTIFSGPMLLLYTIFYAASGWAVLALSRVLLRRWCPPLTANLLILLVLAAGLSLDSLFSTRVLMLVLAIAFCLATGAVPPKAARWILVAGAAASALSVQTKFSNGILAIATIALAVVLTAAPTRERLIRVALTSVTFLVLFPLFWIVAHQRLSDLPLWLRASYEMTSGYSDAMASESNPAIFQYFFFVVVVLFLGIQLMVNWNSFRSPLATLILAVWAALMAFRLGFTRHDLGHAIPSFMLLIVVAFALGGAYRYRRNVIAAAAAAVALMAAGGHTYFDAMDPGKLAIRAQNFGAALVSRNYRDDLTQAAMTQIRRTYAVEPEVMTAIGDRPVQIDPSDAALAWGYQLNWKPVPVIQSYQAYTKYLDQVNADALLSGNGPTAVLRAQISAIDGRNPMWESPRYIGQLVCGFDVAVQSARWQALLKSPDRCGARSSLGTARFAPGQIVPVPAAPSADSMVIATVELAPDPLTSIETTIFKPTTHLEVRTSDQQTWRLAREWADGPLIMRMAQTTGWASSFGGAFSTESLSLNALGTVRFYAVPVG